MMIPILYSRNTVREFKLNRADVTTCLITYDLLFLMLITNFFQADARRMKVKEARKRREERQALKKEEMLKVT